MITVFNRPADGPVMRLKRVKGTAGPVDGGQMYRLERGTPFYRSGRMVYAVPQFRAVNLFSPTIQNALLPTQSITPTKISYPVKVK